ncbi:MAG: hypothetical protein NUV76_12360 [Candidatus Kuenenia sp.]|nr:hypothetical protein [Candidatus Kuenenia sp.]
MIPKKVNIMGMELDEWQTESCTAHFGVGNNWATLYEIESGIKRQGHATKLLIAAKEYYTNQGKKFGGSVALNPVMRKLYEKLNIKEYQ